MFHSFYAVRATKKFFPARIQGLRHGQEMLFLFPVQMCEAIDRVGMFHLLHNCDLDVARVVDACARAQELKWYELHCADCFPDEFDDGWCF